MFCFATYHVTVDKNDGMLFATSVSRDTHHVLAFHGVSRDRYNFRRVLTIYRPCHWRAGVFLRCGAAKHIYDAMPGRYFARCLMLMTRPRNAPSRRAPAGRRFLGYRASAQRWIAAMGGRCLMRLIDIAGAPCRATLLPYGHFSTPEHARWYRQAIAAGALAASRCRQNCFAAVFFLANIRAYALPHAFGYLPHGSLIYRHARLFKMSFH